MPKKTTEHEPAVAPAKRLSLSQILAMMLSRSHDTAESFTLARNARGVWQFEVAVRAGGGGEGETLDEAAERAFALADRTAERYPYHDAAAGGK